MSCLWTWFYRGREEDSDTDSKEKEEQQSEKRKKKGWRKWRIRWKKEKMNVNKEEEAEKEKRLINQQPGKVEEEAHVLGLPEDLVSSLESVSAETLEDTAPPPQEYLTEEEDATIQHLIKTLPDEVGTRIEQLKKAEAMQVTVADEAAAEATNTMSICLEGSEDKHVDHLVSSNEDAADAIRELQEILVSTPDAY
ncbi:hypothetical protein AOLI_G00206790 [Acnodon oligacanthus]